MKSILLFLCVTGCRAVVSPEALFSPYGPGLAKYCGPTGAYPIGTRAVYVYPNSPEYFGYTWLLLYAATLKGFHESEQVEDINIEQLPPGCVCAPNAALTEFVNNATDDYRSWQQPHVYDVDGRFLMECRPVDITVSPEKSGDHLSGADIAAIAIGSVLGAVLLIVAAVCICVMVA